MKGLVGRDHTTQLHPHTAPTQSHAILGDNDARCSVTPVSELPEGPVPLITILAWGSGGNMAGLSPYILGSSLPWLAEAVP